MHKTLSNPQARYILFATILASGMAFLDGSVVNIAVPVIQQEFSANIADMQWIINSYALMLSSLILVSGAVGDLAGRKKVFLWGLAAFTLSSFFCSLSRSITALILFRALQGIGAALMVPGSLSIINVSFEQSVRGRVIGIWSGLSGGVAALGPFLGGWLVQAFGWPSIFLINVPLGMLAFISAARSVPETKNPSAGKTDIVGAALIFSALLGIVYGLIQGPVSHWNALSVAGIAAGIVLAVAFAAYEARAKEPLVPFRIFRSPLVLGSNLVTLCLYFALSGVIFFLVLDFEQVQHYSPLMSGLGLLPMILIITFLSGSGGVLADRIGPRMPMIIGPVLVSLGMALLALPGREANYFLQFMPGLILFGLGMSIVIAPLTKSALSVDAENSGAASGVNNAVARIAGLLAVALLGAIMVPLFTNHLQGRLDAAGLQKEDITHVMSQSDRLGGIQVPPGLDSQTRALVGRSVEDSFVHAFRWIMGINAFLALLSAVFAFITIRNPG